MATIKQRIDGVTENVIDGKAEIASAITDMGVDTDSDATFIIMAEHIRMIPALRCDIPYIGVDNDGYVYMTCAEPENASIYYRVKGDTEWIYYGGKFQISETTTYEAYAIKTGYLKSDIVEKICEPKTTYTCQYNTTINWKNESSNSQAYMRLYAAFDSMMEKSFAYANETTLGVGQSNKTNQSGNIEIDAPYINYNFIYIITSSPTRMNLKITMNGKLIYDGSQMSGSNSGLRLSLTNSGASLYQNQTYNFVCDVTFIN